MMPKPTGQFSGKMGEARPNAVVEGELSDKERWQLVIYIRKLTKDAPQPSARFKRQVSN